MKIKEGRGESEDEDLLGDLFVAKCRKLRRAGTHDGIGRGDVLLGTKDGV